MCWQRRKVMGNGFTSWDPSRLAVRRSSFCFLFFSPPLLHLQGFRICRVIGLFRLICKMLNCSDVAIGLLIRSVESYMLHRNIRSSGNCSTFTVPFTFNIKDTQVYRLLVDWINNISEQINVSVNLFIISPKSPVFIILVFFRCVQLGS